MEYSVVSCVINFVEFHCDIIVNAIAKLNEIRSLVCEN